MSESIIPNPGDSEEHVEDGDEAAHHPDDTVETIEDDERPRHPDPVDQSGWQTA